MPSDLVVSVDRKRIDIDKAFVLFVKHRNFHEVARQLGCSAQAIQQRLSKHKQFAGVLANLETFKDSRLDMMAAAELTLIRSLIDDEAIKKAPLAARATTYGILNERRRLEEGKSTQNVLHGAIVRIQREALDLTMKAISGPTGKPNESANLQIADGISEGEDSDKPHTKKGKRRAKC